MSDDLNTRIQQALTARQDELDLPRTMPQRQVNEYGAETRVLQRLLSELRDDETTKPLRLLAECEERRALTLAKQAAIEQAIADAPDWQAIRDGHERDRERDRQEQLRVALDRLREGSLFSAPGEMFWPLTMLDARREELQRTIAERQARRNALVAEAERVLTPLASAAPVST